MAGTGLQCLAVMQKKEGVLDKAYELRDRLAKNFSFSVFCPLIAGIARTSSRNFAGAVATYTVEALMHDGKALQSGTSQISVTDSPRLSASSSQTRTIL